MILIAYRHGLRASVLTDLRWDQVDFKRANLQVRRVKSGTPTRIPCKATRCVRYAGSRKSRSPAAVRVHS
jgi:integrase